MTSYNTYFSSHIGFIEIITSSNALIKLSFIDEASISPLTEKKISPVETTCIHQLDEYFKGNLRTFDLPIQLEGTAFRQSVWNALQTIPFGKTTSYLQLSKQLRNVKAIRAVGTANGSNPVAIIIPCHRVIGSNGDLIGYAGELWRKKWLLHLRSYVCTWRANIILTVAFCFIAASCVNCTKLFLL
ncbi:MAG: methylated-DNA--[protein]-cysteine S-methyltransferase [Chitinophagaceae bacterium]|nr:methylated-DNA--[protein]-cysteine S-methyltransferase [Chitinophagaceae bacterium]